MNSSLSNSSTAAAGVVTAARVEDIQGSDVTFDAHTVAFDG